MPARDKYTDPKLRDEVKEEIHEGDKGGAPGQWSARKAQMMASEYKKRGGGYTTDKKDQDESQKNLEKWGEEDWQTKDGSGNAKQADGSQKRYLPKKAWENMTEEEKEETDEKKQEASKKGQQHVENTDKAKSERKKANEEEEKEFEGRKQGGKKGGKNAKKIEKEEEDEDMSDVSTSEQEKEPEKQKEKEEDTSNKSTRNLRASTKRQHSTTPNPPASKKQKSASPPKQTKSSSSSNKKDDPTISKKDEDNDTVGSRHDPAKPPAAKGSTTRLPEKGATVHWKALPGYVEGEVLEIVTSHKKVDGKDVKGSEKDPRVVLKSAKSGKICVHKPEACFFE